MGNSSLLKELAEECELEEAVLQYHISCDVLRNGYKTMRTGLHGAR
jgi:hypothetical protein